VTGDYRFQGEGGPTDFAGLFGDKQTLARSHAPDSGADGS